MKAIRQLAAIMFTDIVGYTALMGKDSNRAMQVLDTSKSFQKKLVKEHNGKWLKEIGDGVLVSFGSALDAVNCAIEIQKSARGELDQKLRIGIHLGDVTIGENDVHGDGVNIASRLESICDPGGIYISESIEKAIRGQSEIETVDLGEIDLKNVDYAVRTYAVQGAGLPSPQPKKSSVSNGRRVLIGGGLMIILLLIALAIRYDWGSFLTPDSNLDKSIAVLYFDNLSTDEDNQYFADGIMESILNRLSKVQDLQVTSRTSMEQYRDSKLSIPQIANELGVSYVLEGSVQKYGDQVRITAQLIDAINDKHIWSEEYTEPLTDIFSMMTRIASTVVLELKAKITPGEEALLADIPTVDITAFDYYLQAREDWPNAEVLYRKAIGRDSTFALAYVGLGEVYNKKRGDGLSRSMQDTYGLNRSVDEEIYADTILYFTTKALKLDPNLAEAYSLRGLYYESQGLIEEARRDHERSLELNPNLVTAYIRLGKFWGFQGADPAKALNYLKKASRLERKDDLLRDILGSIAIQYFNIGDFPTTEKYLRQILLLEPDNSGVYLTLLWHACVQGKFDRALAYGDTVCSLRPESLLCYQGYADVYSFMRNYDEAMKYWKIVNEIETKIEKEEGIFNRVNDINVAKIYLETGRIAKGKALLADLLNYWSNRPETEFDNSFRLAEVYTLMGEKGKAMKYLLEIESQNNFQWDIGAGTFLSHYHIFEDLLDDPEFQALEKRIQKRHEELQRKVRFMNDEGSLEVDR